MPKNRTFHSEVHLGPFGAIWGDWGGTKVAQTTGRLFFDQLR
jgi:hypothetical protein